MISALFLSLALASAPPPVTLYGDIVSSYKRYYDLPASRLDANNFHFDQADLGIQYAGSDWASLYTRLTLSGASVSLSEAYVKLTGLPLEGSVTIGRFYKPLGAPVPLTNLSFPALLVHAYPEFGAKINVSRYPFAVELGVVNGNTILGPLRSVLIGGTPALTTGTPPNITDPDNNKDYYGRVALVCGEDWGSLTTGVTYTGGRLTRQEVDFLNRGGNLDGGLFISQDLSERRDHLSVDLDYQKGPFRLFGEFVSARDGRVRRKIWTTAGSFTWFPKWGQMVSTIGYDKLDINAERVVAALPQGWNRDRVSLSQSWWPTEFLSFQAEYDWNHENVAGTTPGSKLKNDLFTLQSILYF